MAGERVRRLVDREPIWRKLENRVDKRLHKIRNRPGSALAKRAPQIPNRNFGGGITVGTVQAGISIILEETVGVPFGGETEITDAEPVQGGTLYTVNVNSPFENMARAKAFFEANTGFASLLTDLLEVEDVEVLRTRPLRDTYQVKVLVHD